MERHTGESPIKNLFFWDTETTYKGHYLLQIAAYHPHSRCLYDGFVRKNYVDGEGRDRELLRLLCKRPTNLWLDQLLLEFIEWVNLKGGPSPLLISHNAAFDARVFRKACLLQLQLGEDNWQRLCGHWRFGCSLQMIRGPLGISLGVRKGERSLAKLCDTFGVLPPQFLSMGSLFAHLASFDCLMCFLLNTSIFEARGEQDAKNKTDQPLEAQPQEQETVTRESILEAIYMHYSNNVYDL